MTYNDMPVIIPLLATGYLLTIYLLLILAQRTIKSSRYVADSVTDAYASYVPTKQAPHSDDVEQRSRIVQRSPTARWSKTEPNSSATSFGATTVTSSLREPLPFGKGFAQRRKGNAYAPIIANGSLTLKENATLQGAATPNGNAEQEPLQGSAYVNTQEKDGTSPSKSVIPEL
jgi:hypothetical protein